jgi:hypothetical protein
MPCRPRHGARLRIGTGLAVEQATLGLGLHQRLVGVLAVDIHQQIAQVAQLRRSRRCR